MTCKDCLHYEVCNYHICKETDMADEKYTDEENEKYYQAFRDLGIKVEPLPSNYNPEEYGRRLLSMSQSENGVSYAASTSFPQQNKGDKNETVKP